jgi:hypothetical protein
VHGLFGYIELATCPYLVLIEEATLLGQILKSSIYRVDKLLFVPLTYTYTMDMYETHPHTHTHTYIYLDILSGLLCFL